MLAKTMGENYEERVLPSLVHDSAKSVLSTFSSAQLQTQRSELSYQIKSALEQKARDFYLVIDDVVVTSVTLGKTAMESVEKRAMPTGQVVEKAVFVAEQARSEKTVDIGLRAAETLSSALRENPSNTTALILLY